MLLVLAPAAYVAVFLWWGPLALLDIPRTAAVDVSSATPMDQVVVFAIAAMTPTVYWLAFWRVYRLSRRYAGGEVFSQGAARQIRLIGLLLLLVDFVHMLETAITGPVLTLLGLSAGFISVELRLGVSVVGLLLVLISRVMVAASELQEQQRLTV